MEIDHVDKTQRNLQYNNVIIKCTQLNLHIMTSTTT